jgi:hypothetical protein
MPERRPLCIVNGQLTELPTGDTLPGAGAGGGESPWIVATEGQTLAARVPVLASLAAVTDPHWNSVVSLLRFNGANGSTTFTDDTGKIWTPSGAAQLTTANPRTGSASGLFNAASTTVITTPSVSAFQFAGDFTIEVDVRLGGTRTSSQVIFITSVDSSNTGGCVLYVAANSRTLVFFVYQPLNTVCTSSVNLVDNVWTRVAISRNGTVVRMFLDGVQVASGTWATTITTNWVGIGRSSVNNSGFLGQLDNFRVTNGVGRYTSNYVVDTAEYPNAAGETTVNFPLPASITAGDEFTLRNSSLSAAGTLAAIDPGGTRQIVYANGLSLPTGDSLTLAPGEQATLVARSTTVLELQVN